MRKGAQFCILPQTAGAERWGGSWREKFQKFATKSVRFEKKVNKRNMGSHEQEKKKRLLPICKGRTEGVQRRFPKQPLLAKKYLKKMNHLGKPITKSLVEWGKWERNLKLNQFYQFAHRCESAALTGVCVI